MRISAVLACHDEERFIQAWLEGTSTYADEILIAVHAPTDATANIIAKFKWHSPVPIRCEWFPALTVARFGFSLMKNEMIARATGDWVTSIDADEEIGLTRDELRQLLDAATSAGRRVLSLRWAAHPHPEERTDDWTMDCRERLRRMHVPLDPRFRKCKVFRNHAGFWWHGLIHEELACNGRNANRLSLDSDAYLHHYAYLNCSVPKWKELLYAYLICRIRDCPHLRAGTNSWWYEDGFVPNEAGIRAGAGLFQTRLRDWFPEIPRRDL